MMSKFNEIFATPLSGLWKLHGRKGINPKQNRQQNIMLNAISDKTFVYITYTENGLYPPHAHGMYI